MHDPTSKFSGTISPSTERIAKIISLLEQPPFLSIPAFAAICIARSDGIESGLLFTFVSIVATTILPLAIILFFSKRYKNDDRMDIVNKEDRMLPLIFGVLSYALGTVALYLLNAPEMATVLMLCYTIVTAAIAIITPYWKISIHSCGVVGPSLALSMAFWPIGLAYFLLLPPVVWSRYVLKKHTPLQLLMGAVIGFVLTEIIFFVTLG